MRRLILSVALATMVFPQVLRAQQDLTGNLSQETSKNKRNSAAADGTIYVQDKELRTAKYNTIYAAPPSRNRFIDPGSGTVEARFNQSFRRFFYYCTSEYSRLRCDVPFTISRHPAHFTAEVCTYPFMHCKAHSFADMQLVPDNTTRHSNSARFFSFDGYLVYGQDTLYGIVTITKNEVGIEHQSIADGIRNSSYDLTDKNLRAITVFKGMRELNLVRVLHQDKHLSRVVHAGKLSIYDRKFSFLTATNISRHLRIVPSGGSIVHTNDKQELLALVNSAYGISAGAAEMETDKLFTIINRLN